jgi:hypothetical protein
MFIRRGDEDPVSDKRTVAIIKNVRSRNRPTVHSLLVQPLVPTLLERLRAERTCDDTSM